MSELQTPVILTIHSVTLCSIEVHTKNNLNVPHYFLSIRISYKLPVARVEVIVVPDTVVVVLIVVTVVCVIDVVIDGCVDGPCDVLPAVIVVVAAGVLIVLSVPPIGVLDDNAIEVPVSATLADVKPSVAVVSVVADDVAVPVPDVDSSVPVTTVVDEDTKVPVPVSNVIVVDVDL